MKKILTVLSVFLLFVVTKSYSQTPLPISDYNEIGEHPTDFSLIDFDNEFDYSTNEFNVNAHVKGQDPWQVVLISAYIQAYDIYGNQVYVMQITLASSPSIPSYSDYSTRNASYQPVILPSNTYKIVYNMHTYTTQYETTGVRIAQYTVYP